MSVAGITGANSLSQSSNLPATSPSRRFEFQQLGQDLQSGNLAASQQDFAQLTKTAPQTTNLNQATTSSTSNATGASSASQVLSSGMAQDFAALGQALQAGNLSSAKQAYSAVQNDEHNTYSGQAHHHLTTGSTASTNSSDPLLSVLSPNGTSLQNSSLLSQIASNVGSTMPLSLLAPSFSAMI